MTIQLTNTMTRRQEPFAPSGETVRLYTCGPTVYDFAHIGNWRSFIFDDTLRRALEYLDLPVRHVMNVTDVGHLTSDADEGEDKLEKGAAREGKTVWDVAQFYLDAFLADRDKLNVLPPHTLARATDYIPQQIDMIGRLIDKGYVYQTPQALYFDVTKLPDYGKLTGQKLADKREAARSEVVTDPAKHHPYDFAVWFFTVGHFAGHAMHWPSPWGDGFPGWHLECSAIIHATLGDNIDIHTGGIDHIGTHHTNEIAQTEAAFGQPLAKFWLHNDFVLVDGGKMSKSKGNYYTLADLEAKGFSPLAFRLLCLQAHYRSELNFTLESLGAAQNYLLNLYAWVDRQFQPTPVEEADTVQIEATQAFDRFDQALAAALADDLNTPQALAALSHLVDALDGRTLQPGNIEGFDARLTAIDQAFGLSLSGRQDISSKQHALVNSREQARVNRDFAEADRLRRELTESGLEIEDTPDGPRWRRKVA